MALSSPHGNNDSPVHSPVARPGGTLQPRYRRLLTFGAVLDESMFLFRRHWVNFALVSAVSLLPPGLVLVWMSSAGTLYRQFTLADLQSGRLADPVLLDEQLNALGALLAYVVVSSLFGLLWTAAILLTTDAYLRGEEPSLSRIYGRALNRYGVLLVSSLLYILAMLVLILLASALFVVTLFGVLGSLAAGIGLLFWWLRPTARTTWLQWLIILTAPFGLPTYFAMRWAMYLAAITLEDDGPLSAFRRSSQLTDQHWFRVAAILTVASMIVATILYVLDALVTIPFTVAEAMRGQFGLNPTEAAINGAATTVAQILLTSIGTIVYTLLFVDLRNRREGTDILERVTQLEASIPTNG
jgi:hypothetical protein